MAKWGEGDPRWIVEERPDAVNVNNWHWTEKNATPWSKERLKELLEGRTVEKGPVVVKFTNFKKIDGEATANNRKAKLIFLFEWNIELKFTVKVAGSDIEYDGYIEVPNLSDENEADEVDVTLSLETTGPHDAEIRHLFNNEVTAFIRKQMAVYIRELKEEFSKGLILPTDRAKPQVITKGKSNIAHATVDKKTFQNHVVTSSKKEIATSHTAAGDVELKSISLSENFKVQPDRLWEVLTDLELVKKWSNGNAHFDLRPDGEFALFNSMVTGSFLRIEQNKELDMKWRLKSYPSEHYANVRFILEDEGDSTKLNVEASGVPCAQADDTENGIRRFYLQSISRTFGFGAHIF
uniref:Aha1_N domain-containing protein n=1 Tax=Ascaris lumbricoides TaxID=6252 RepID=A0A0M3I8T6_ASCLU